jgi:hypothetical protein
MKITKHVILQKEGRIFSAGTIEFQNMKEWYRYANGLARKNIEVEVTTVINAEKVQYRMIQSANRPNKTPIWRNKRGYTGLWNSGLPQENSNEIKAGKINVER